MADDLKDLEGVRTAISRLQGVGLTAMEVQQIIGLDKLTQYVEPLISRSLKDPGVIMNRDISGHIHTTG